MKMRFQWVLTGIALAGLCSVASARPGAGIDAAMRGMQASGGTGVLVKQIVQATSRFRDVKAAEDAGYVRTWGCVSNDNVGAMGIHYVNSDYVADPEVYPTHPEALVFEPTADGLQLVAAEYVTIKEDWDAIHPGTPPVMLGQLFFFMNEPNRFELPPVYFLHAWFKPNPNGVFSNWNPDVQCGGGAEQA